MNLCCFLLWSRCTASPAAAGGVPGQAAARRGPAAPTLHPEGHRHLPEQPLPGSHRYARLLLILNTPHTGPTHILGKHPGALRLKILETKREGHSVVLSES